MYGIIRQLDLLKNQSWTKPENQALIFRFRWGSWPAATFGRPNRTTRRTATSLCFDLGDQNGIRTMSGKNPDKHLKTAAYRISGQLKRLENEQAELFRKWTDILSILKNTQPRTKNSACQMKRTNPSFFETSMNARKPTTTEATPEDNVSGEFRCGTQQKLGEIEKALNWLVEQIPNPGVIEEICSYVFNYRKTLCDFTQSWQKTYCFIAIQKD